MWPARRTGHEPAGARAAAGDPAIGMGAFYSVYYAAMMLGPVVGGAFAKWSGSAAAAFDFGAAVLLACPVLLWVSTGLPASRKRRDLPHRRLR